MDRDRVVRALLVGGPMYDGLYARLPAFEAETGLQVEVLGRLPHPELNARVRSEFGSGEPDVDLLSTHTKYSPSQAQWLSPLEDVVEKGDADDLLDRPAELARIDGRLLQYPRNLDLRLLYFRRDLFEDPAERAAFEERHRRPLRVPETWDELVEVAIFLTRPGLSGFLFPGRDSGLFGTFYELLVAAAGTSSTRTSPRPSIPRRASGPPTASRSCTSGAASRRRSCRSGTTTPSRGSFARGARPWSATGPGATTSTTTPRPVASPIGWAWRFFRRVLRDDGRRTRGATPLPYPRGPATEPGAARLLRFLTSTESQVDEARRGQPAGAA